MWNLVSLSTELGAWCGGADPRLAEARGESSLPGQRFLHTIHALWLTVLIIRSSDRQTPGMAPRILSVH